MISRGEKAESPTRTGSTIPAKGRGKEKAATIDPPRAIPPAKTVISGKGLTGDGQPFFYVLLEDSMAPK
jgi:hypothetical protein